MKLFDYLRIPFSNPVMVRAAGGLLDDMSSGAIYKKTVTMAMSLTAIGIMLWGIVTPITGLMDTKNDVGIVVSMGHFNGNVDTLRRKADHIAYLQSQDSRLSSSEYPQEMKAKITSAYQANISYYRSRHVGATIGMYFGILWSIVTALIIAYSIDRRRRELEATTASGAISWTVHNLIPTALIQVAEVVAIVSLSATITSLVCILTQSLGYAPLNNISAQMSAQAGTMMSTVINGIYFIGPVLASIWTYMTTQIGAMSTNLTDGSGVSYTVALSGTLLGILEAVLTFVITLMFVEMFGYIARVLESILTWMQQFAKNIGIPIIFNQR